jgi:peptidoglycan/LPS O-acetylase OafA/YrhL
MRSWLINSLKFVCAQLIVMHHICGYGPMRETLLLNAPQAMEWFIDCTRLIVQVFLVMGGFLAAQSLSSAQQSSWMGLITKRFTRLAPFYWLTLLMVIAMGYLLSTLVSAEWWWPQGFEWRQFITHAFLLQGVMGQESISAGVWYVAIDFQLFALLSLCVVLGLKFKPSSAGLNSLVVWSVFALTVLSFWCFNRFELLDNWCIYFMGAYGIGVLAHWGARHERLRWIFCLAWVLGWCSVIFDPRIRIALALSVSALLFAFASQRGAFLSEKHQSLLCLLGDSAYATFLSHFMWIMVFSALWNLLHLSGPWCALLLMLLCWVVASAWGVGAHLYIERPLMRWTSNWLRLGPWSSLSSSLPAFKRWSASSSSLR